MKHFFIQAALLFCILLTGSGNTFGQGYWLFLRDKGNQHVALAPEQFLTQASWLRRAKFGLPPDSLDLPVYKPYIDTLQQYGIECVYASRWLNAVYTTTVTNNALPDFVVAVRKAAVMTATNCKNIAKTSSTNIAATTQAVVNLNALHQKGFKGSGIKIGILDAGFKAVDTLAAFAHLRNRNGIVAVYDFVDRDTQLYDEDTHGLHCFAIIGADLAGQYTGSAPDANFYLGRTEYMATETKQEEYRWIQGAEWLDSLGVDIISSSLNYNLFDGGAGDYRFADLDGKTAVVTIGAQAAASRGILVVNSAGNEGANTWRSITPPCDAPDVLCVGSVRRDSMIAASSSRGPTADNRIKPDVAAPGEQVPFIGESGRVGFGSGTSYAAPLVAGMAACLLQAHPETKPAQMLQAIRQSAHLYNNPNFDMGYGIPDARIADSLLSAGVTNRPIQQSSVPDSLKSPKLLLYPNPATDTIYILAASTQNAVYEVEIQDAIGRRIKIIQGVQAGKVVPHSVQDYPYGTYQVELRYNGGTVTGRFVVK